jgi:hypothetical protein
MLSKLIQLVKANQSEIILALSIVAITVISFNLGKISALNIQKAGIKIVDGNKAETISRAYLSNSFSKTASISDQTVVASKNSKTKIYHFTWCPGASKIAEKNKIVFANEAAAIAAGYTLAGNCRR